MRNAVRFDLLWVFVFLFMFFFSSSVCTYFEPVRHAQWRQPSHANKERFLDHAFVDAR